MSEPAAPMHLGIVFQGPTKPRGFDIAQTLEWYRDEIEKLAGVRVSACFSTWRTEEISPAIRAFPWPILELDPPSGGDYLNRHKQIFGAAAGAKYLAETAQPDFLLKMRCDLQVSLPKLVDLLREMDAATPDRQRLLFPVSNGVQPFYLCDFFFGGRTTALLDFLDRNLAYREVFLRYGPEMDFPLRYLLSKHPEEMRCLSDWEWFVNIFDYPYLWQGRLLHTQAELWPKLRAKYFALCPRTVFEEALWRGEPVGKHYGVLDAVFADTRGDFGAPLPPLRPLPWWGRAISLLRSAIEYTRWRLGIPLVGPLLGAHLLLNRLYLRLDRTIGSGP